MNLNKYSLVRKHNCLTLFFRLSFREMSGMKKTMEKLSFCMINNRKFVSEMRNEKFAMSCGAMMMMMMREFVER
jgi:hypothetical protein